MLTKKQRQLLYYIHDQMKNGGLAPSFEEMKEALGLQSKSGIHRLISALVERGYLERLPHRARALEVRKLPDGYYDKSEDHQSVTSKAANEHGSGVMIPFLGKIAAGTPIEAIRDEGQTIEIPSPFIGSGEYYALRVDGDSMIKAGIFDGDTIIIQRCERVNDGEIAVALIEDSEVTLKRLYRRKDHILLKPENDHFQDQKFQPHQVMVQGRLSSLLRLY